MSGNNLRIGRTKRALCPFCGKLNSETQLIQDLTDITAHTELKQDFCRHFFEELSDSFKFVADRDTDFEGLMLCVEKTMSAPILPSRRK